MTPTLDHLDRLHDTVETPGGDVLHYWWIYARPDEGVDGRPTAAVDYEPYPGSNEGVACVDDVARIATLSLEHYELYGDDRSLERARRALEFVLYMQHDDGTFLNFVADPAHNEEVFGETDPDVVDGIRVDGSPTSRPALEWWSTRACWALGEGYRTFAEEDPAFADDIAAAIHEFMDAMATGPLDRYGEHTLIHGWRKPEWLLDGGAYATAPAVLGLAAYHRASGDRHAATQLRKLAEGVVACAYGDATGYPFGAHTIEALSGGEWHVWGMRQVAALARAGAVLDEQTFVSSAREEVTALYTHLLASHTQLRGFGPVPLVHQQLSYAVDAMVQGCTELWLTTGERVFARLGSLFASWYFGNNPAGARMYDPETGRGFDGIYTGMVDYRAGAESTVGALRTLLAIERYPEDVSYHRYGFVRESDTFRILDAEGGSGFHHATPLEATGENAYLRDGGAVKIYDGGRATVDPDVAPGRYRPYLVHQHNIAPEATLSLTVDGRTQGVPIGGADDQHFWMDAVDPVRIEEGTTLELAYAGPADRWGMVDAVVLQPVIERRVLSDGDDDAVTILRSFADEPETTTVPVPIEGACEVTVRRYDRDGERLDRTVERVDDGAVTVSVEPAAFSLVDAERIE